MIIVYAYVCGDLIHMGHLLHLQNAKAMGDKLIVGVLTNKAIMEKKPHPVIPFSERLALVSALKCVDLAIPQNEYVPHNNVTKVGADILIESPEHGEELLAQGRSLMKALGGRMVILTREGQSSTGIKEGIESGNKA